MNRFLRLIFIILIAGAAMNLTVVLWANARSRQRQERETHAAQDKFLSLATNVSTHWRRADLVVESQRLDAYGKAIETTLLVRQYAGFGSDQGAPLKISRVRIPGDTVVIDGVKLDFTDTFAEDAWQYQNLRGLKLAYFGGIHGVTEKMDAATSRPALMATESFKFMEKGAVPQLTRVEPDSPRPSSYESFLWFYLWNLIPDVPPASRKAAKGGLEIEWLQSKPRVVQREHIYTAYIGGKVLDFEDNSSSSIPRLLETMLAEGQSLEAEAPR